MERPLRPEEASLKKKGHTSHRPAGVKSCITAIQSSPQFLGMGPTHSSLKINKEDVKKWGRSREHVPLTLLAYGLNAAAHTGQTRRAWVDFSGFLVMGIPFLPHQGGGIGGARVCDSGRSG